MTPVRRIVKQKAPEDPLEGFRQFPDLHQSIKKARNQKKSTKDRTYGEIWQTKLEAAIARREKLAAAGETLHPYRTSKVTPGKNAKSVENSTAAGASARAKGSTEEDEANQLGEYDDGGESVSEQNGPSDEDGVDDGE